MVFNLIQWAEAQDQVEQLLHAARQENPWNWDLKDVLEEVQAVQLGHRLRALLDGNPPVAEVRALLAAHPEILARWTSWGGMLKPGQQIGPASPDFCIVELTSGGPMFNLVFLAPVDQPFSLDGETPSPTLAAVIQQVAALMDLSDRQQSELLAETGILDANWEHYPSRMEYWILAGRRARLTPNDQDYRSRFLYGAARMCELRTYDALVEFLQGLRS